MQPDRAPAVAVKLEAARVARSALDTEVAQAALDVAEGVRGADKRLADLRTKVTAADRDVAELEKAHDLALRLDLRAGIAARAKMRESQLATFTGHARARDAAVAEICDGIGKLAGAYGRYINLTARMLGALPAGARLPVMNLGPNGSSGSAFGDLKGFIAAEAFRLIDVTAPIRAKLPFAAAPSLSLSDNPGALAPGAEVFHEATAAVINEVRQQCAALDAEDAGELGTRDAA